MANQNSTKVVTGIVRLSYANVWEPTSVNGGTPKYGVSLIIPKSDKKTITAINKAMKGLQLYLTPSEILNLTAYPMKFIPGV